MLLLYEFNINNNLSGVWGDYLLVSVKCGLRNEIKGGGQKWD